MRRLVVPGLVAALAVGLVALLIFGVLQTTDDSSIDQAVARGEKPMAKSVELTTLDGTARGALADYRGRTVLVNFWASWCGPCKTEAPLLNRVQRMLEAEGGTVIGVTVDDTREDSAKFVADHDIDFPIYRDPDRTLNKAFALKGVPESFLIDPQGRIVALERQQISQAWIDRNLAPLLAEKQ